MSPPTLWTRSQMTCLFRSRITIRISHALTFNRHASIATKPQAVKRAPSPTSAGQSPKEAHSPLSTYHLTPMVKDEQGRDVWPVPLEKMEAAREFIREW